jgi:hypothetical protein
MAKIENVTGGNGLVAVQNPITRFAPHEIVVPKWQSYPNGLEPEPPHGAWSVYAAAAHASA